MGLGGLADSVGTGLENLAHGVEHAAGKAIDTGAHAVGAGLDAVGLHGAAQAVDHLGDAAADRLGASVAERQLGETEDPTELIHGDVGAVNQTIGHLRKFATAFDETAKGLAAIDTEHWDGRAAQGFRAVHQQHPKQWVDAASACEKAAEAWAAYAHTVQWAQGQALQAIDAYKRGKQASEQARQAYNQQVNSYNRQAAAYNNAAAGGGNPGSQPQKPGPFTDPGLADQQRAQEILTEARRQRDSAARQAQTAISEGTNLAPTEPSFANRILNDGADLVKAGATASEHVVGGVLKGAADIVKFARTLNPFDPYNITHPAQYLDGVSSTAAGLLHSVYHPMELVKGLVGTGWSSDPAEAFGKLIPNIALGALTDGAGTAAEAGASAAQRAAVGVGERAAASAGERAAVGAGERAATVGSRGTAKAGLEAADQRAASALNQSRTGMGNFQHKLNQVRVNDVRSTSPASAHTINTPPPVRQPPPLRQPPPVRQPSPIHDAPPPVRQPPVVHEAPPPVRQPPASRQPPAAVHPPVPPAPKPIQGLDLQKAYESFGKSGPAPAERVPQVHPEPPRAEPAPHEPGHSLADNQSVRHDLDQSAVHPDIDVSQLGENTAWRQTDEPLYRVDTRHPLEDGIFGDGFAPRNKNVTNLDNYVGFNNDSGFVSTSRKPEFWAEANGEWYYKIDAPGGVDVNASIGKHTYESEKEIAMPGGIRPERIQGAWKMIRDPVTNARSLGEWVPNPNYVPIG